MSRCCGNCHFARKDKSLIFPDDFPDAPKRCHRYPLIPVIYAHASGSPYTQWEHPPVPLDEYCGEWKRIAILE